MTSACTFCDADSGPRACFSYTFNNNHPNFNYVACIMCLTKLTNYHIVRLNNLIVCNTQTTPSTESTSRPSEPTPTSSSG
jgi:hypothetical protein